MAESDKQAGAELGHAQYQFGLVYANNTSKGKSRFNLPPEGIPMVHCARPEGSSYSPELLLEVFQFSHHAHLMEITWCNVATAWTNQSTDWRESRSRD